MHETLYIWLHKRNTDSTSVPRSNLLKSRKFLKYFPQVKGWDKTGQFFRLNQIRLSFSYLVAIIT